MLAPEGWGFNDRVIPQAVSRTGGMFLDTSRFWGNSALDRIALPIYQSNTNTDQDTLMFEFITPDVVPDKMDYVLRYGDKGFGDWEFEVTGNDIAFLSSNVKKSRMTIPLDGISALPTGKYGWELEVIPYDDLGNALPSVLTQSAENSNEFSHRHIDRDLSVFATMGWGLSGLDSLDVTGDGDIAIIRGSGATVWFEETQVAGWYDSIGEGNSKLYTSVDHYQLRRPTGESQLFDQTTGRLVRSYDQIGNSTAYEYWSDGRLKSISDHLGNRVEYSGSASELIMTEYIATSTGEVVGKTATFSPDSNGRLQTFTITGSSGSRSESISFGYDPSDRISSVTNSNGVLTSWGYDSGMSTLDSISRAGESVDVNAAVSDTINQMLPADEYVNSVIGLLGNELKTTTDNYGNMTREEQTIFDGTTTRTYVTEYVRDELGRVRFAYDAYDLTEGRGIPTQYGYHTNGYLSSITYPDGSSESWTYDFTGGARPDQPLTETDRVGRRTTNEYDGESGQLSASTISVFNNGVETDFGVSGQTNYEYYDSSDAEVIAVPSRRGLLKQMTGPDPDGPSGPLSRPVENYFYDSLARLEAIETADGMRQEFGYDSLGNIEWETSLFDPTQSDGSEFRTYYGYDGFGNTTEVTSPDAGIGNGEAIGAAGLKFRTTADFNGDGIDDVAGMQSNGDWIVYSNDGGNQFSPSRWMHWATADEVSWLDTITHQHVMKGDFNGDGREDIVMRIDETNSWWVGLATSADSFLNHNWSSTWVGSQPLDEITHAVVGDYNGDGQDDVAVRDSNGDWQILQSNGSAFAAPEVQSHWARSDESYLPTVTWVDVHSVDLNNDGRDDIVGRIRENGAWWVSRGTATGSFPLSNWAYWDAAVNWRHVGLGDFNNDGFVDILGQRFDPTPGVNDGAIHVLTNNGLSFTDSAWLTSSGYNQSQPWRDAMVGDFNGDGLDDFIARNSNTGEWKVARSSGSSLLTPEVWETGDLGTDLRDVVAGQFDTDGETEILARSLSGMNWLELDSSGSAFNRDSVRVLPGKSGQGSRTSRSEYTQGRVDFTTDDRGAMTTYVYQSGTGPEAGQLDYILLPDPDNLVDANGNLILDASGNPVPDPNDTTAAPKIDFVYEDGLLVEEIDPVGNSTHYAYDELGRVIWMSVPIDQNATVTDSTLRTVYEYDPQGRVTKETVPLRLHTFSITEYDYDDDNHIVTMTQSGNSGGTMSGMAITGGQTVPGRTTTYRYDASWRILEVESPAPDANLPPLITTYKYIDLPVDGIGPQEIVTQPTGLQTIRQFSGDGRLLNVTQRDPDGGGTGIAQDVLVTSYTYDIAGRMLTTTETADGQSRSTSHAYDSLTGRMQSLTLPDPDGEGGPLSALTTRYTYDARGNLSGELVPDGTSVVYRYNGAGQPTRVARRDALTGQPLASKYLYNGAGQNVEMMAPDETRTFMTYDVAGQLATETLPDPDGDSGPLPSPVTNYFYDRSGYLDYTTNQLGYLDNYGYSYQGHLLSLTQEIDANTTTNTTYKIDVFGNNIWMRDGELNTVYFEYDDLGRITNQGTGQPGNLFGEQFVYNQDGHLESATDTLGRTTTYKYDNFGRATQSTDARGFTTETFYDGFGRVDRVEGPPRLASELTRTITQYRYDQLDRIVEYVDPMWNSQFWRYDDSGRLETQIDELGRTTHSLYDGFSRQNGTIAGSQMVASSRFDAAGRVVQTTNGIENSTWFDYDALGRTTKEINALSGETSYTYDPDGNLSTLTDPENNTTTFEYDRLNRLTSEQIVVSGSTLSRTFGYDKTGNRTSKTDRRGQTTTWNWSFQYGGTRGNYRLDNEIWQGANYQINYNYDPLTGLLLESVSDSTSSFEYRYAYDVDDPGLVTSVTDALNPLTTPEFGIELTYGYDPHGRRIQTDVTRLEDFGTSGGPLPPGVSTFSAELFSNHYRYDHLGRVRQIIQNDEPGGLNAPGIATRIDWYRDSTLKRIKRYEADSIGQTFSTGWLSYAADMSESLYVYDWDTPGRLTDLLHTGIGSESNSGGSGPSGPSLGLKTESSGNDSIDAADLNHRLYIAGDVTAPFEEAVSGRPPQWWFDQNSQSQSEPPAAAAAHSDFVGPLPLNFSSASAALSGSGATTGGFQLAYHWEHDDASRIVRMETPNGFTDFDYDNTDQLFEADHDYTTGDNLLTDELHAWDANGNPDDSTTLDRQVVMLEHNRLRYVYTENNTKLQIYSYDHEGNRTRWFFYEKINGLPPWTLMRQVNYDWDFRNRLTAVTFYVGGQLSKKVEYTYDAYDRRLTRHVDADGNSTFETKQRFVYDTNVSDPSFAEVIMILDETNHYGEESRFLQGAMVDQVFAEVSSNTGSNVEWLLPDHHGTIRDVFDYESQYQTSSGEEETTVTSHLTYDSFGRLVEVDDPETIADNDGSYDGQFTYTGREWDEAAELYYYRARWYDPVAQRFVSEDPMGFADGTNMYLYVHNRPINLTDPTGLFGEPLDPYLQKPNLNHILLPPGKACAACHPVQHGPIIPPQTRYNPLGPLPYTLSFYPYAIDPRAHFILDHWIYGDGKKKTLDIDELSKNLHPSGKGKPWEWHYTTMRDNAEIQRESAKMLVRAVGDWHSASPPSKDRPTESKPFNVGWGVSTPENGYGPSSLYNYLHDGNLRATGTMTRTVRENELCQLEVEYSINAKFTWSDTIDMDKSVGDGVYAFLSGVTGRDYDLDIVWQNESKMILDSKGGGPVVDGTPSDIANASKTGWPFDNAIQSKNGHGNTRRGLRRDPNVEGIFTWPRRERARREGRIRR